MGTGQGSRRWQDLGRGESDLADSRCGPALGKDAWHLHDAALVAMEPLGRTLADVPRRMDRTTRFSSSSPIGGCWIFPVNLELHLQWPSASTAKAVAASDMNLPE
jgi:hypothetical protein